MPYRSEAPKPPDPPVRPLTNEEFIEICRRYVAAHERLFAVYYQANPELVEASGEWVYDEGCLSVPGHFWPIERSGFARARGLDMDGNEVVHEGEELMGRVLQHEIDHLNGTLLLERLPRRVKKQALRELREEALGLRAPE